MVAAAVLVLVLGSCSQIKVSYSAICARCLQHASGVEKSIFGVIYHRKEVHRQTSGGLASPDIFGPPISNIDPRLYEEIHGHSCAHDFKRTGFCRYSFGSVGCGSFGGHQYRLRNALIENLYRAYLRVPDKRLSRESFDLIDQLYPSSLDKVTPRPPFLHPFEASALPNEPLSILLRGLALVSTAAEWRQLLDAARAGDGSLDLLNDPDLLAARLAHKDPSVRRQVIDQLVAMKKPEAWTMVASALTDPECQTHAVRSIVFGKYFPLFDAVFEAVEGSKPQDHEIIDAVRYLPEPFDRITGDLTPGEIRTLLAQGQPRVDRVCLAAIRQQNRFEFLDEIMAVLNARPSPSAVATIESLLEGPYPLDVTQTSSGESAKDPWASIQANTSMTPVESITGLTAGGKRMYKLQQEVVSLGKQRDPGKWSELRELNKKWLAQGGAEWWAAGFAQAMVESDREKTLEFLASELDTGDERLQRTTSALAGLGILADPKSLPALQAFRAKCVGSPFEKHPHYRRFLDYALHRCQGIHLWRLAQNTNGTYFIEK